MATLGTIRNCDVDYILFTTAMIWTWLLISYVPEAEPIDCINTPNKVTLILLSVVEFPATTS